MKDEETMVSLVEEYLTFRRNLGFGLENQGKELLRFARYADQSGHRGPVTIELAIRWAKLPEAADRMYWARRLEFVRGFARHRATFEPGTEIPPEGIFGPSRRRRDPYIYSDEQVTALLQAASQLEPIEGLTPHTFVTVFGLLACTGLRVSEALRLKSKDVDLEAGVLTIRPSKFKKSRLVPLHPSTARALGCYAERRKHHHPLATKEALFLSEHGNPLGYTKVRKTFRFLRKQLGWVGEGQTKVPRIHDLRHRFAVRTLLRWYKEGSDVDHKIATLATYLGHSNPSNTYWYLTGVPELLAVVGSRFEEFAHKGIGGIS